MCSRRRGGSQLLHHLAEPQAVQEASQYAVWVF
jgi:hypothetical protein